MAENHEYRADDYLHPGYWGPEDRISRGKIYDFFSGRRPSRRREIGLGASILNGYFMAGGRGLSLERITIDSPFDAATYGHGAVMRLREESIVLEKGYPVDLTQYEEVDPPPRHNPIDDYEFELASEHGGKELAFGSFVYWGVVTQPRRGGVRFNTYSVIGTKRNGQLSLRHAFDIAPSFTVGDTWHVENSLGIQITRVTELQICTVGTTQTLRSGWPVLGPLGQPQTARLF